MTEPPLLINNLSLGLWAEDLELEPGLVLPWSVLDLDASYAEPISLDPFLKSVKEFDFETYSIVSLINT